MCLYTSHLHQLKVTIIFLVDALTVGQPSPPVALIILDAFYGLFRFYIQVEPVKLAFAMLFIIQKLADIEIAVRVDLDAATSPLIIHKFALINFALLIDKNSLAPFLLPLNLAKINLAIMFNQFQIIGVEQIIERKEFLREETICGKIVAQLLLVHAPDLLQYSLFLCCVHPQHLDIQQIALLLLLAVLFRERKFDLWVLGISLCAHNKFIECLLTHNSPLLYNTKFFEGIFSGWPQCFHCSIDRQQILILLIYKIIIVFCGRMADLLERMKKQIMNFSIMYVGKSGTGKSSMITRYAENKFTQKTISTVGIDFVLKKLKYRHKTINLELWDTSGQEVFRAISVQRYKRSHAIIFVYDMSDQKTIEELTTYWIPTAMSSCQKGTITAVFGNKSDLIENPQKIHQIKLMVDQKLKLLQKKQDAEFMHFIGSCKMQEDKGITQMMSALTERLFDKNQKEQSKIEEENRLKKERGLLEKPERKSIILHEDYFESPTRVVIKPKRKCLPF